MNLFNEPSIVLLDSADFRKSYAALMFDTTATLDKLEIPAPSLVGKIDPALQNKLVRLGFMNKDSIITTTFETVQSSYSVRNKIGDSLRIFYSMDTIHFRHFIHFQNKSRSDSLEINSEAYTIAFADFIPGGFPEIFLIENVYIMNGDNYYLKIYKVRK